MLFTSNLGSRDHGITHYVNHVQKQTAYRIEWTFVWCFFHISSFVGSLKFGHLKIGSFQTHVGVFSSKISTPPKMNMELEGDRFQKEFPVPGVDFQVPC